MKETRLPVGIHSFRTIRENGFHYVDKTGFAAALLKGGRRYFLSRPRRFGKSLFVQTLKELFESNEKLFRGLAIYDEWDWTVRYPVISLTFSGNFNEKDELKQSISEMLDRVEVLTELSTTSTTLSGRFSELIFKLERKTGQPVVVLVDEYDKPILDAVRNPEIARSNREILQGFFSALKDEDDNIRFCFITGVSRFAHVNLFSGANHLHDITLTPEFSSICGYTESDLDNVFSEEIAGLNREEIRDWYNGYCWLGDEKVYNPFGILLLLKERTFRARWYGSGTPRFLIDVMEQRGMLPAMLEGLEVSDSELLVSDLEQISAGSLLLQTGYMTIVGERKTGGTARYKLDYPNREVRQAFNESMLASLLPQDPSILSTRSARLAETLEAGDVERMKKNLHAMSSGIPHQWHAKPGAANYESYFASVVYGYFLGSGIDVRVEDTTSEGRIDLAAVTPAHIYLFEFKVVDNQPSGKALEQLRTKNYADKYMQHGRPIHLVAVEFSKNTRNIAALDTELA